MAHEGNERPSPPPFDPEAIPEAATLRHGGSALELVWHDGTTATLTAERLRRRCRCAWCTCDRAVNRFPDAFPGIAVTRVEPLGGYAVHLGFSDGHARGIFPWSYLRALAAEAASPPPAGIRAA